jgi:hypothetical protein
MYRSEGKSHGMLSAMPKVLTTGTAKSPIVQEARWVPKPGWTGVEKRKSLGHIGVQTLNRPPRSEFLYWLNEPAPFNV